MISRFFIDRPIFASVLSIVIVLAGLVAMRVLPIAQYPEIVPPQVVVSATYPGASAADDRRDRGRSAGAADQRRRGHDLHAVDLDRLGHAQPFGLLPDRHQPGPGDDQRQQPRPARDDPAARRGAPPGCHRHQAVKLDPAGLDHVVAGSALRHPLHLQLRSHQRPRRAAAHPRRRRRLAVRRLRLLHAHLAAARQGRAVPSHSERHRRCRSRAERPVRGRAVRRGADGGPSGLHLLGDDAGPLRRSARVRADHPALGRKRCGAAAQGRRARRARLAELRHRGDPQRVTYGADRHLPAARRQRVGGCRRP